MRRQFGESQIEEIDDGAEKGGGNCQQHESCFFCSVRGNERHSLEIIDSINGHIYICKNPEQGECSVL